MTARRDSEPQSTPGADRDREPDATPLSSTAELRRRAEAQVASSSFDRDAPSPEQVRQAFHDLRVHQVELEMQNEELRRAQVQLEESRARYFDLYDLAPVGYFDLSENGVLIEANLTAATLLDVSRATLAGQYLTRFMVPDDEPIYFRHRQQLFETGMPQTCELRMLRSDGAHFWAQLEATMRRDREGGLVCRTAMSDISVRKQADEALRVARDNLEESNQQLEETKKGLVVRSRIAEVFLTVPDEEMYAEVLKIIIETMDSRYGVFGYIDDQGALVVPSMTKGGDESNDADKKIVFSRATWGEDSWPRAIREKKANWSNQPSSDSPPGHMATRRHISMPMLHQGRVVGLLQVANKDTDYTEADVAFLDGVARVTAPVLDARLRRDALERERERLLSAIEQAGDMVVITDPEGTIQYVNPAFERTTGYGREEAIGQNSSILRSGKQDEAFYRELWETISSGRTFEGRMVNKRKDGTLFTEEVTISPVRDVAGRVVNYVAVKHDITAHLRLSAELQQAQKMESVGRLAGGVAHDSNNMLSVIIGYADLALARLPSTDPLHADLTEILDAARRSAQITRQLLAFARKQTIRPEVLDLNVILESTLTMLRRLIGENIHLVWSPKGELWPVNMDPAQVDQILTNLCVNARDAIDGVGTITVATSELTLDESRCVELVDAVPGEFVVLSVSDDGCGMAPAILEKLFEPFFTTKETGQGTGLGLATVYGIVKQNGGFIGVDSEPGKGTTFKVHVPRHVGNREKVGVERMSLVPKARGETVLLVEDEPAILKMGVRMLKRLGYNVVATISPEEALRVSEEHDEEISLLLTDVVMPEMNGRDLAAQLQARHPQLKVLFMSGYTASVIAQRGVLEEGVHFIQKPFSTNGLAFKVRALLDSPSKQVKG